MQVFLWLKSAMALGTFLLPFVLSFDTSVGPLSFCKLLYASTTLCANVVFDIFLSMLFCVIPTVSHEPELSDGYVFSAQVRPKLIVIIGLPL